MGDISRVLAYLSQNFQQWEIIRDGDGWRGVPSARLVFYWYLRGIDVPDLYAETALRLLILLEAWRATLPPEG